MKNPSRDWCNVGGAKALAQIITAYWSDRGYLVNVEVESQGKTEGFHTVIGVRSDMVGGLPRFKINKAVRV